MEKNISINKFRNKFKKKSIGAWLQLSDPNIAKIVSKISYINWICLDLEHGLIDTNLISRIIDSVENSNKIILFCDIIIMELPVSFIHHPPENCNYEIKSFKRNLLAIW